MSQLSLAFDILARDNASATFKRVGDSAENAGKKGEAFGKALATAAVAGVAALAGIVKSGFGELQDYQAGFAQAEAVIKSTGGSAGVTSKHVEDLAGAIQGYSGQTDDSIVAGENLLLTFTNIRNEAGKGNDVFDQTTKILADVSQSLGQDTKTSAIQLGKALNDPINGVTALQKVGVTFTAEQKKTIKALVDTGNSAGAQKVILAELTKEFGGSARAFGESGPGQIAKAKRSFEDVTQSIATALLPVITKLMTFVNGKLIPGFKSLADFVIRNKAVIAPLAVVLGTLGATVFLVVKAVKAFTIAQAALDVVLAANPIGLVVIAVAALAAGLIYAYKHSKTFRDIVNNAFSVVAKIASTVFNFFKDHWPLLLGILTGPFGLAVGYIIKYRDQIVGAIKALPGLITSAVSGAFDGLKSAFRSVVNFIIDGLNGLHFTVPSVDTHIPGVGKIGGFSVGVPYIPRLAEGGIVQARPGGTLAVLGEAGRSEAVIPLSTGGAIRIHDDSARAIGGYMAAALNGMANSASRAGNARVAR